VEQRIRTAGAAVSLNNVRHQYGDTIAVESVSLSIQPGELLALLGPSGCGKTTLLRIVAGLARQSSGQVSIGGRIVDALAPNARGAGIVFQNYALFPHMTVAANVAYGLRATGVSKKAALTAAGEMLTLVQMEKYAHRYPHELSGGQQQRVALARTLAVRPSVLLLDEPFAALDKNLRLDMQIEIRRIQQELGITTILVTHDQEEAMSMADKIAVMYAGKVEQFDRPEIIYDSPASLFVANFIGTANQLAGTVTHQGDHLTLHYGDSVILPFSSIATIISGAEHIVVIRPEGFALGLPMQGGLKGVVRIVMPLGAMLVYEVELAGGATLKIDVPRARGLSRFAVGDTVGLSIKPGASVNVFPC
jgi:putative spermidine/putrescine transport system ATP-binding protein